jgi:hypothetical protein
MNEKPNPPFFTTFSFLVFSIAIVIVGVQGC